MEASDRQAQKDAAHALKHNIDMIPDAQVKQQAKDDLAQAMRIAEAKKVARREASKKKHLKKVAQEAAATGGGMDLSTKKK